MNLFSLATRDLRANPLQAGLTVALTALAVALAALLASFSSQLADRLERDAAGIDLVVGAKGSPLQLVLAGVYHLDVPPGNIPWSAIGDLRTNPLVRRVVPLALGDSCQGLRIVGTDAGFLDLYGARLAAGRSFEEPMEAVLGAEAARRLGLTVGGEFVGAHGFTAGEGAHVHADMAYTVTGILAATGTVADRLILTPVESVWWVHREHAAADEDFDREEEATIALVQYASPLAAAMLPRAINDATALQAAAPAYELARLLELLGVGGDALTGLALLLAVVAGLVLFAGLTANLRSRRAELAVFRLLGASRRQLFGSVVLEALLLGALGVAVGLALAHGLLAILAGWLVAAGRPVLNAGHWAPAETLAALAALGLAVLAALGPAWRVSRLDVAAVLGKE